MSVHLWTHATSFFVDILLLCVGIEHSNSFGKLMLLDPLVDWGM